MSNPDEKPSINADAAITKLKYPVDPEELERIIEDYPQAQADTIRWWYFYGKERFLSLTKLANLAGVSAATFSRLFRGNYGADLGNICSTLAKAKKTVLGSVSNPDFVKTSLAKLMYEIFDEVRELETMAILWGEMGIGKTIIGENYKEENNHGRTIYYRMGTALSFGTFIGELALAMGITTKNRPNQDVRGKIKRLLAMGQRLLIIDELHLVFETCRPETALKICEFIRELHDCAKCGVVTIGTKVLRKHIFTGVLKDALGQLVDRGTIQIELPARHTKGDVKAIHRHFGLKEPGPDDGAAARVLADLVTSSGLRKLTLHLRAGARLAALCEQTFTWGHFVEAHDRIISLGKTLKEAA